MSLLHQSHPAENHPQADHAGSEQSLYSFVNTLLEETHCRDFRSHNQVGSATIAILQVLSQSRSARLAIHIGRLLCGWYVFAGRIVFLVWAELRAVATGLVAQVETGSLPLPVLTRLVDGDGKRPEAEPKNDQGDDCDPGTTDSERLHVFGLRMTYL